LADAGDDSNPINIVESASSVENAEKDGGFDWDEYSKRLSDKYGKK
jgi:hypothetical protein